MACMTTVIQREDLGSVRLSKENDWLSVLAAAACNEVQRNTGVKEERQKKRPRLAPFPSKLKEICADFPDVVCWDYTLRALVIRDVHRLQAEVMPRWFNCNGAGVLKSFTRQLNYYGFHRVSLATTTNEYSDTHHNISMKPLKQPEVSIFSASSSSRKRPARVLNLEEDNESDSLLLLGLREKSYDEDSDDTIRRRRRRSSMDSSSSSQSTSCDDIIIAYGCEALFFVNKDPTINGYDHFGRLIRCEKAADRQPPPGLNLAFRSTKTRAVRPALSIQVNGSLLYDDNSPSPTSFRSNSSSAASLSLE